MNSHYGTVLINHEDIRETNSEPNLSHLFKIFKFISMVRRERASYPNEVSGIEIAQFKKTRPMDHFRRIAPALSWKRQVYRP